MGAIRREVFNIELFELPDYIRGTKEKWQADCGDCHARGLTPSEAVAKLVDFTRAHREWQLGRGPIPKAIRNDDEQT